MNVRFSLEFKMYFKIHKWRLLNRIGGSVSTSPSNHQILTFHVASFDASQKRYVVKVDDRSGDGQGCDEILNSLGLILPAIMFKKNKSMAKRHTSPQNSMIFKGIILNRTWPWPFVPLIWVESKSPDKTCRYSCERLGSESMIRFCFELACLFGWYSSPPIPVFPIVNWKAAHSKSTAYFQQIIAPSWKIDGHNSHVLV